MTEPITAASSVTESGSPLQEGRVAALDGYRGVAILVVMLHHAMFGRGFPDWLDSWTPFLHGGVTAFWVLSGFLICRSLIREETARGSVDIWAFYRRQAARFYPPMLAYLLVAGLLFGTQQPEFTWTGLGKVLLLHPSANCTTHYLGHLYSLVLQIHFCLALPWVLRAVGQRWRIGTFLLLGFAASAWWLLGRLLAVRYGWCELRTDFFWGPLLIGSAFALAEEALTELSELPLASWLFVSASVVAAATIIITRSPSATAALLTPELVDEIAQLRQDPTIAAAARWMMRVSANVALAAVVLLVMHNRVHWLNWLLSFAPLRWLGRISFSVYLWQNVFCFGVSDSPLDWFPWNIVAAIVIGWGFYHAVEKPSLRWRSQLKTRPREQTFEADLKVSP